ncbi:TPA: hypothetical protein ACS7ZY_000936 [Providencia alcalifaciens]|nr:hypothetical protein [Providencia alcalifaciens]
MGIYILNVVPKDITYIPTKEQQGKIAEFLTRYGVKIEHVTHEISHGIQCHVNPCGFDTVECPHCHEPITLEWICHILSDIYDSDAECFHLKDLEEKRLSPCCHKDIVLTRLNFTKTITYSIYNADFDGENVWNRIALDFPTKVDRALSEYIGFPAEILLIRM